MTTLTREDIVKTKFQSTSYMTFDLVNDYIQKENRARQELALKIADNIEFSMNSGLGMTPVGQIMHVYPQLMRLIRVLRSAQGVIEPSSMEKKKDE